MKKRPKLSIHFRQCHTFHDQALLFIICVNLRNLWIALSLMPFRLIIFFKRSHLFQRQL